MCVCTGPIISLEKSIYDVTEPANEGEEAIVHVLVQRHGDASKKSVVRLYTKDGNAESGKDYEPLSKGELALSPRLILAKQNF